jgi:thiamine biosynthesis lipoprotein
MIVRAEPVMGTVVSFHVAGSGGAASALDRAVAWLHQVDERFSPFRPDSEVTRLADGRLAEADAHPHTREVLALVDLAAADSDGAFDARRWRADGRIDPSGLVKGWAVERAARDISAAVDSFSIDAGGDVIVRSAPSRPEPWRIGIRHPDRADRVAAVLRLRDGAVATSAAYERGAHIRDPRDGHVPSDVRSMTVVGPDLTWADTFATAAYVMGRDGLAWVAGHPGYDALAITWDDAVIWTAGMDGHLLS